MCTVYTVVMEKSYLSYADIHQQTKSLAFKIHASNWMPQVIVGLSRGGMLPATLLSHNWRLPVKAFNLSLRDQSEFEPDQAAWLPQTISQGKRVLVVDDINDSGATINWIKQDWQSRLVNTPGEFSDHVRFAVLLNKHTSQTQVDYCAREIPADHSHTWWVFPWENLE